MKYMSKTSQTALGGIIAALSVLFLICTGLFPFSTYVLPAAAGALIIIMMIECSPKRSLFVYAAVSALSFFVVPDREAAMMYVGFFGFYPVVKSFAEKIKNKAGRFFVKISVFNVSVIISYLIIIYLFGLDEILSSNEFGALTIALLLLMGNICFVIYDRALTSIAALYVRWFAPKYLRRKF